MEKLEQLERMVNSVDLMAMSDVDTAFRIVLDVLELLKRQQILTNQVINGHGSLINQLIIDKTELTYRMKELEDALTTHEEKPEIHHVHTWADYHIKEGK